MPWLPQSSHQPLPTSLKRSIATVHCCCRQHELIRLPGGWDDPWSMVISGSNTWRYVLKYHIFGDMKKKWDFPWKVWAWNIGQTYMVGTSVLNRFLSHDHWHEMFYPLVYTLNWQLSKGNMMIFCGGSNGENLLELCRQTQVGDTLLQFNIAMV